MGMAPVGLTAMLPDVNDGDKVRVEFDRRHGTNKRVDLVGTVESDPYLHRVTPGDSIDLSVQGENGHYYARVTEDGSVKGLHHATERHDHLKGANASVEVL